MAVEYIDRPPRIQPELPVDTVELPQPPDTEVRTQLGIGNLLLPLVMILGFAFVSGSGSSLFIIPMGLMVVISVAIAVANARSERKKAEAKKRDYLQMLSEKRQEMTRSHNAQRLFYRHNYPDIQTLYEIADRKETSRFGSRLWERRTSDSDFGVVRLGMGTRPSSVIYTLGGGAGQSDESRLHKDAARLAQDSAVLTNVPITIPLRPFIKERGEEPWHLIC